MARSRCARGSRQINDRLRPLSDGRSGRSYQWQVSFMLPSNSSAARFARRFYFFLLSASLALGSTCVVSAAPINYGDFVGSTVTYRMVTEDSGTDTVPPCMYCAPTVGGDTLNFNP